jgi:hypothetical protein
MRVSFVLRSAEAYLDAICTSSFPSIGNLSSTALSTAFYLFVYPLFVDRMGWKLVQKVGNDLKTPFLASGERGKMFFTPFKAKQASNQKL